MKNIAKELSKAIRETELYSPMYGKVWLDSVDIIDDVLAIIYVRTTPLGEGCCRCIKEQSNDVVAFYGDGTTALPNGQLSKECMLFPNENKTWQIFEYEPTREAYSQTLKGTIKTEEEILNNK